MINEQAQTFVGRNWISEMQGRKSITEKDFLDRFKPTNMTRIIWYPNKDGVNTPTSNEQKSVRIDKVRTKTSNKSKYGI